MQKPTFDWLERYFPGVFRSVHFVPIWVPDNKVTKADICQQIGAEYLIGDVPEHCNIAAKTGIKALLFGDYAWNRNDLIEDRIVRVKDWPAVMEYFDGQK